MNHTMTTLEIGGLGLLAREAHWFDMSQLFTIPLEVRDFGHEMAMRGLLYLPHDKVVYWFGDTNAEAALACERLQINGRPAIRVNVAIKRDEDTGILFPAFYLMTDVKKGDGDQGSCVVTADDAAVWVQACGSIDEAREITRPAGRWIAQICGALLSPDMETERIGPAQRVIDRQVARGARPAIVYRLLKIKPNLKEEIRLAIASGIAQRKHPKLHWRRGHIRDLSGGARQRLVPIPPCIVGSKREGMVIKDYALAGKS
jgi:hypothetical protein